MLDFWVAGIGYFLSHILFC